jgi:hypothetical protein
MTIEDRVGYMAVAELSDMVKDYIIEHTVDKRYVGDLRYLTLYEEFQKYLVRK